MESREDIAASCAVAVAMVPDNFADLSDDDLVAAIEANVDRARAQHILESWPIYQILMGK
jgi:hypothetical protein